MIAATGGAAGASGLRQASTLLTRRGLSAFFLPTLLTAAALLGGCAQVPKAPEGQLPGTFWSGRLSLQVESTPPQSFFAGFELKGQAAEGELALFTPLGSTLAVLAWTPGSATMKSGGELQRFDSLDALVTQATGTPIPVAALFDWLAGTPTAVPGWQPDLSQLAEGRLAAKRTDPAPVADLRLALEK